MTTPPHMEDEARKKVAINNMAVVAENYLRTATEPNWIDFAERLFEAATPYLTAAESRGYERCREEAAKVCEVAVNGGDDKCGADWPVASLNDVVRAIRDLKP